MKGFEIYETKNLIEMAKGKKLSGNGLSGVFKEYALNNSRAPGSVRNYYYKTLERCEKDEKLRLKLGVTKEMFPAVIKEFNQAEEIELLENVFKEMAKGCSVRRATLNLANGNEKLALRYQNKYRNLLKEKPALVNEICKKVEINLGVKVNAFKHTRKKPLEKVLESKIDELLERVYTELKKDNEDLQNKLGMVSKENDKLKEILKKAMKDKNFTQEYFTKNIS